jgi:hypothetical protein
VEAAIEPFISIVSLAATVSGTPSLSQLTNTANCSSNIATNAVCPPRFSKRIREAGGCASTEHITLVFTADFPIFLRLTTRATPQIFTANMSGFTPGDVQWKFSRSKPSKSVSASDSDSITYTALSASMHFRSARTESIIDGGNFWKMGRDIRYCYQTAVRQTGSQPHLSHQHQFKVVVR